MSRPLAPPPAAPGPEFGPPAGDAPAMGTPTPTPAPPTPPSPKLALAMGSLLEIRNRIKMLSDDFPQVTPNAANMATELANMERIIMSAMPPTQVAAPPI